jgi:hypothetical protein
MLYTNSIHKVLSFFTFLVTMFDLSRLIYVYIKTNKL